MLNQVLIALAVVAIVGILAGVILALASHFMHVPVDETTVKIRECLPGANCGACGYAGCDEYANALTEGGVAGNLCIPGGVTAINEIADILGVEAGEIVSKTAVVGCNGKCDIAEKKAEVDGIPTCTANSMLYGGPKACVFGCIGCGDCASACPSDAIDFVDGIAVVDKELCTGCGACTKACPKNVIKLIPKSAKVFNFCNSKDKGAVARKACKSACIGCKKCEIKCESGAIKVENNLAVIDYEKCTSCGICAENCPTKSLKILG